MRFLQARILRTAVLAFGLAAIASAGAFASPAAARTFSEHPGNLIADPGAEGSGEGVPGWTGTPGYTATSYGASGEYPGVEASEAIGPPGDDGGARFFDPGTAQTATLTQIVDVEGEAAAIDAGERTINFGGWLGGYESSSDTVEMDVTPLDSANVPLAGAWTLQGPSAAQRSERTMLLDEDYDQTLAERGVARPVEVLLPAHTRKLRVQLIAVENEPSETKNHGYADELYLSLGEVTPLGGEIEPGPGLPANEAPVLPLAPSVSGSPTAKPPSFEVNGAASLEHRRGVALLNTNILANCPPSGASCRVVVSASARFTRTHRDVASVSGHDVLVLRAGSKADLLVRLSRPAAKLLARHRHRTRIDVTLDARQGTGATASAVKLIKF